MEQKELFKKLTELNVNEHTEQKDGLTYLSWAWAWQKFLEICPDATYEIKKFTNAVTGVTTPYLADDNLGYMVFTSITACGTTKEMWLPVMDGKNKAMKSYPYEYTVKGNGKEFSRRVEQATMFDVNKAIMRCLTKNIAMFGLGLYIYAGEDLPSEIDEPITDEQKSLFEQLGVNVANTLRYYKVDSIDKLTKKQADYVIEAKRKAVTE